MAALAEEVLEKASRFHKPVHASNLYMAFPPEADTQLQFLKGLCGLEESKFIDVQLVSPSPQLPLIQLYYRTPKRTLPIL